MIKIRNLKFVIILEYQSIKIFSQTFTLQIGQKKFLWLKKLKIVYRGHLLLAILTGNNFGAFYENELQKTSQK